MGNSLTCHLKTWPHKAVQLLTAAEEWLRLFPACVVAAKQSQQRDNQLLLKVAFALANGVSYPRYMHSLFMLCEYDSCCTLCCSEGIYIMQLRMLRPHVYDLLSSAS